jgi:hypothetical protein
MANRPNSFRVALAVVLLIQCTGQTKEEDTIRFNIFDEQGAPTAARVRITDMEGNYLAPVGHLRDFPMTTSMDQEPVETDVLLDEQRRFAYVDGAFRIQTTEQAVRLEVVKGFNYQIYDDTLALTDKVGPYHISLNRAFESLPDKSWYSGDIHVHHINKESALLEMKAEDLNVCNLLISDFTLDHHNFTGAIEPESDPEHIIFYGQEYREDRLGHINLLNLTKNLIEPAKEQRQHQYPLNMEAMDQAHEQSGHVSWAHFAAWPGLEGPLAVVMKKVDAVELLCTIDPFYQPIFVSDIVPEVRMNSGLRLWYRLLNCGFKIPITAGTDKMGNFVTVGANRTYAKVPGSFSYQSWIDALNQGETFVSNSPFLLLEVNGNGPGSTLKADQNTTLSITAQVWSQMPVDRLEIVANGALIGEVSLDPTALYHSIEISYQTEKSVWLAARAYQLNSRQTRKGLSMSQRRNEGAGPTQLNRYYGTLRPEVTFAHTSPVYVTVDDLPIRSSEDAQYFVGYLNNAIKWLDQEGSFPSDQAKQEVLEAFELGRQRFMAL